MATVVWEKIARVQCDRMKQEADLLEERVYADDIVPGVQVTYHVRSRMCSLGLECNLAGFACRWAFTNPGNDPFADIAPPAGE